MTSEDRRVKNSMRAATLRILDANANRAGEGLRTLEEAARFILNDEDTSRQLKRLRHRLREALAGIPTEPLLRSRDTPGDVGTAISVTQEQARGENRDVVAAAATRTQQALRCLEEYGKTISVSLARAVEAIRYDTYEVSARLQLSLGVSHWRRQSLSTARLYALIDGEENADSFQKRIESLIDAGVHLLQLRDKELDDRTLYERAVLGQRLTRNHNVLWIINDRADIAAACDADGIHVGQEELPVDVVRDMVGPDALIGISTHDLQQVQQAHVTSADYLGCGPTFAGNTKSFDHYPGCEFLEMVARWQATESVRALPAFAIGGIDQSNVAQVVEAGFGRIAVTAALQSAEPKSAANELVTELKLVALHNQMNSVQ